MGRWWNRKPRDPIARAIAEAHAAYNEARRQPRNLEVQDWSQGATARAWALICERHTIRRW